MNEMNNQKISPLYQKYQEIVLLHLKEGPKTIWEVVSKSGIEFVEVVKIVNEMLKDGLVKIEKNELVITEKGESVIRDLDLEDFTCGFCSGRGVRIFERIKKEFEEMIKDRPRPLSKFVQGFQTIDSNLARLAIMYSYGDVKGRSIIVLGDDDLMSLALAMAGAKHVAIIDIDKRLVDFINKRAKERGFDIETLQLDLSNPLPENYIEKFDVFVTDPLETLKGFKIMVGRGIAAVKVGGSGYFSLTRVESSIERWNELQRMLIELNTTIDLIIPRFTFYENWDYLEAEPLTPIPEPLRINPRKEWYNSSLYRIIKIREMKWNEKLELDEETLKEEKFEEKLLSDKFN